MEQYRTENEKLEKDLPTLREVVGGTWKKEEELNLFKSEVVTLDVPQIRSPVNKRSATGYFITDHVTIGHPEFHINDENRPKRIKM